ncbi:inverse autotransporter beta domain-containing protein, partial [Enterobacter mori]
MQIFPHLVLLMLGSVAHASVPQNVDTRVSPVTQSGSTVATSMARSYATDTVEHWLQQFGTAEVKINVDEHGNFDDSSIDLLAPVYTSKQAYFFTQLGLRSPNGRTTGNLGVGIRTLTESWMYGGNVFFDNDFTGRNQRIGFGAEAWANYLKFSANTYIGVSNWHNSRDFNNFYEKPANGFDVRVDGYIPSFPQLGARVMYEKYYGNRVALFDKDHLQDNPSAMTVGLNYTPFPLITAGIDYRHGQDSTDETRFNLNFRYSFGQSWQNQISPAEVDALRRIDGSRYDLVDRNNEIILQYKEKTQKGAVAELKLNSIKDNSPADGVTTNIITVQAISQNGTPVQNAVINWSTEGHAKLSTSSGITDKNGQTVVQLTNTEAEQVNVLASSGAVTQKISSSFVPAVASLGLELTQNNMQADGNAQNAGKVTVKDTDGNVISGVQVDWNVDNGAVIVSSDSRTNNQGTATVHFSNSTAGNVILKATAAGKSESVTSTFVGQQSVASIVLSIASPSVIADGVTQDTAQALVTDDSGKPVAGYQVHWTATGNAKLSAPDSLTNAQGVATVSLSDSKPEVVLLSASAGDKTATGTITFTAGQAASVAVATDKTTAAADGTDAITATATVTDAHGNPVDGATVTWSASNGAQTSTTTVQTNASGVATAAFTSTTAGQST